MPKKEYLVKDWELIAKTQLIVKKVTTIKNVKTVEIKGAFLIGFAIKKNPEKTSKHIAKKA